MFIQGVHLDDRVSSHFFPLICPSSKILHIQKMRFLKRNRKSRGSSITRTTDLSEGNSPLPTKFEQMIESLSSLITSDDLQTIQIESANLVYYYLETIVDLRRLYDEIVPQFERLAKTPG
ncbi:hypothetical protein SAMN02745208_02760 [Heyndrickxia coagulans DSM 1 = ATCC 7050]|uniref:Uncharacterized protein n=3 Tax=Heyndrickxia coagulans TaxID=1398 RepID=A0A8B4C0H1_HEYCO|nr:hypothetical protein SAMN02745208_02760 [Heyndrickxia coagulans DSM 1 = ATCC 7050]